MKVKKLLKEIIFNLLRNKLSSDFTRSDLMVIFNLSMGDVTIILEEMMKENLIKREESDCGGIFYKAK